MSIVSMPHVLAQDDALTAELLDEARATTQSTRVFASVQHQSQGPGSGLHAGTGVSGLFAGFGAFTFTFDNPPVTRAASPGIRALDNANGWLRVRIGSPITMYGMHVTVQYKSSSPPDVVGFSPRIVPDGGGIYRIFAGSATACYVIVYGSRG